VHTLGELLDHLPAERRDVVRLAAGDEVAVHHDLLIDHFGAGIAQLARYYRLIGNPVVIELQDINGKPTLRILEARR